MLPIPSQTSHAPRGAKLPLALMLSGLLFLSPVLLGGKEPAKKHVPPGGGSGLFLLDNFEDGGRLTGSNWKTVTDKDMGGNSKVEAHVVPDGAQGSKHAFQISGEAGNGFQYPFAGVALSHPAKDLHDFSGVTFYTRGDGNVYELQVSSAGVKDHNYFTKEFLAPKEWTQVRINFKDLKQNPFWGQHVPWTGTDVQGVFIRRNGPGKFQFEIDDVAYFK